MALLNTCEMPIRWTDLDAYAHVNHSIFFNFMTEARAQLLKDVLQIEGMCHFVTAEIVNCKYKRAYRHPDTIILKQYCEEMSTTSFNLKYEFFSKNNPDVLYAEAIVRMVTCNPTTGRPTRIPEEVLKLLKAESEIEAA